MSIYGNILFERKHEKVLNGIKKQDNCDTFREGDRLVDDLKYDMTLYNIAKKPSRKVSRLRDIFHDLAYNGYHSWTDEPRTPDREQSYHFGKMEIFV